MDLDDLDDPEDPSVHGIRHPLQLDSYPATLPQTPCSATGILSGDFFVLLSRLGPTSNVRRLRTQAFGSSATSTSVETYFRLHAFKVLLFPEYVFFSQVPISSLLKQDSNPEHLQPDVKAVPPSLLERHSSSVSQTPVWFPLAVNPEAALTFDVSETSL
ncbi:hypothetical protein Dimus_004294 [Dionaea muscipula]